MNNHSCEIYALSQIGSTEWVEENMDTLASRAIAYLNVDISIFGPGGLRPRATPQLDELIKEASKMVFRLFSFVHITMLYKIYLLYYFLFEGT